MLSFLQRKENREQKVSCSLFPMNLLTFMREHENGYCLYTVIKACSRYLTILLVDYLLGNVGIGSNWWRGMCGYLLGMNSSAQSSA